MKLIWFEPWGWIYRPISWVGWLLVSLTIVFLIPGKLFDNSVEPVSKGLLCIIIGSSSLKQLQLGRAFRWFVSESNAKTQKTHS